MIRLLFSRNGWIRNAVTLQSAKITQGQINSTCSTYNMTTCRNFSINADQTPIEALPKKDVDEFMSVFPIIEKDLIETYLKNMPSVTTQYFSKLLRYNLTHGKLYRAVTVVSTFKLLKGMQNITEEDIKVACILGWCTEMLQATALTVDDIMDQAEYRRGSPCWYKLPEVGLQAINDSFLLENAIYALLKKYIPNHPFYISIMELFHEAMFRLTLGQMLDMQTATSGKINIETFNMDTYKLMVFNKTTFYSFITPIVLPLYLAKKHEPMLYSQLFPILKKMGVLFQTKDDILDCFGNYEKMGKKGFDISTGKRTWLAIKALENASAERRQLFEEHYGKDSLESEEKIRNVYTQLGLQDMQARYEEELANSICSDIKKIPSEYFPQQILLRVIEKFLQVFSTHLS